MAGVLDRFPELKTVCVVPLGLSQFNRQPRLREHTVGEAQEVVDLVDSWQQVFLSAVGRRVAFAADEYYLLAGREFPEAHVYEDFEMYEDGIGMARTLELEFNGEREDLTSPTSGFFAWVDGAPADGYRAPRSDSPASVVASGCAAPSSELGVALSPRRSAPVGVLTGILGAPVVSPLVASIGRPDVRVVPIDNQFFGGNIGVTGLMVGEDLVRVLDGEPEGHRYLLPDVCLSRGQFLDGATPADLPRPVEILPTHGRALRDALELS